MYPISEYVGNRPLEAANTEKPMMVTVSMVFLPSLSPKKLPRIIEPTGLASSSEARPPKVAIKPNKPIFDGKNNDDIVTAASAYAIVV